MKGGKRVGAGRPKATARPMPISWRPDTQAQRDMWLELGGARWIKRLLNEATQPTDMPYLNRLIDRLLMPLPATGEREVMALHNEAAQMLHLLSRG